MIDWTSKKIEIFYNPRMPANEKNLVLPYLKKNKFNDGHIWLSTSGSSGQLKWVALSKTAILNSAHSVNKHLKSDQSDIWLNVLPHFHIGGLSIYARGFLSRASVIDFNSFRWDPILFIDKVNMSKATLTALVPAQIYDLVKLDAAPPSTLRAVIVGGGDLNEELYLKAINKGWKLLPSYGLTECSSQIATAPLYSWKECKKPKLQPLGHVEINKNEKGFLRIKSLALLTGYCYISHDCYHFKDPKENGWLTTEDLVRISEDGIEKISRGENFVKIGGESVDLLKLEKILDHMMLNSNLKCDIAIFAVPDQRLGHIIHLATDANDLSDVQHLVDNFQKKVFPFEQIRAIHKVAMIPRSPLKKILKQELLKLIQIKVF